MKTLAVDIGNTRTKAAVFEQNEIIQHYDPAGETVESWMEEVVGKYDIHRAIVSSTSDATGLTGIIQRLNVVYLDHTTPLPVSLVYDTPETLGRDRIAGVVGAHHILPGKNVLVVDAGTCITYDLVTADGVFIGGNISPGLDMRLRSMHEFTARLPLVRRTSETGELGRSTSAALQFGAENGVILEIEGYISRLDMEHGNLSVILTGGDSAHFAKKLKTEIFVRPNLVLIGLNEILRYNVA